MSAARSRTVRRARAGGAWQARALLRLLEAAWDELGRGEVDHVAVLLLYAVRVVHAWRDAHAPRAGELRRCRRSPRRMARPRGS